MRCERCGHKWIPRVENPKACPKCKGYTKIRRIDSILDDMPEKTEIKLTEPEEI